MQKISFATVNLYYSCLAIPSIIVAILIEAQITGESVQVLSYSGSQYGWMFLTGLANFVELITQTIANQNEKSGLITMFGYMSLVYACGGDLLIFNESFAWLEVIGIVTLLTIIISLICVKCVNKPTDKKESAE